MKYTANPKQHQRKKTEKSSGRNIWTDGEYRRTFDGKMCIRDRDGNEIERHSSDDEPFSALAFKIMTDPFVGKLAYFRVYSGTMNSGSYVLNATKGKKERVGRILQMHANKRQELDKVYAGDIAAAIGFKFTTTGDTICDEQHPVILESCLLYTSMILNKKQNRERKKIR